MLDLVVLLWELVVLLWDLVGYCSLCLYRAVVFEKCFVITLSLVSQTAAINVSVEMRIPNTKGTSVGKYNTKHTQNTITFQSWPHIQGAIQYKVFATMGNMTYIKSYLPSPRQEQPHIWCSIKQELCNRYQNKQVCKQKLQLKMSSSRCWKSLATDAINNAPACWHMGVHVDAEHKV